MAKIAVVGRRENVLCYLAAGFSVYCAEDSENASRELRRASKEGAAVIFVSPEYCAALAEDMAKFAFRSDITVTTLPKKVNGTDSGALLMKRAVERAVGADIIYKE